MVDTTGGEPLRASSDAKVVLVVDDDALVRGLVARALADAGYINAPAATLRYEGRQYRRDCPITAQVKKALQHMLDARHALLRARS